MLAKQTHAGKTRKRIGPTRRDSSRGGKRTRPYRSATKRGFGKYHALLHAVGCDGAYLREHVLPSVVDAVASPQQGLMVVQHIPGETDSRLELLLLAMKRSIRWEQRVAQENAIGGFVGRRDHVWKNLRFPSQTIAQAEIRKDLPLVLSEECVILIVDARSAGLDVNQPSGHAILEVKNQRAADAASCRACLIEWSPLSDPARECAAGVKAFARSGSESVRGRRRGIVQKTHRTVEDVAPGEKSAKYLRVVRVQPIAAKLEIMLPMDNGKIVAKLRAPNRFVYGRFEEEGITEAECRCRWNPRHTKSHGRVRRDLG